MRSLYLLFTTLILFCPIVGFSAPGNTPEMNDSLFGRVVALVNAHEGDSLYNLLGHDFQADFSREKFAAVLKSNLYPLGKITSQVLISYKDGLSSYKAVCEHAALEFRIKAEDWKIVGLRFLPYKEPVALKDYAEPSDNPMKSRLDSQVDAVAREYINKVNTAGISIGLYRDGALYIYNYGATQKKGKLPTEFTIYELGSITKTFTATLLAYFVQQRLVSLSDPITKYLPDSVTANKNLAGITLQMLFNHTSGLPRMPSNFIENKSNELNPYKHYTTQMLYDYLKDCKLDSRPGEKYAYSNLAVGLMGKILEHVSGKSYEQLIKEIICQPLAMKSTYQRPDADETARQTSVHNEKGSEIIMWDLDALAGAGCLRSDVHDMLLYARANLSEGEGTLASAIKLTHQRTFDGEMEIGLGWHMSTNSDTMYFHAGRTGGCSTSMILAPGKKCAVVMLSNSAEDVDATAGALLMKLR